VLSNPPPTHLMTLNANNSKYFLSIITGITAQDTTGDNLIQAHLPTFWRVCCGRLPAANVRVLDDKFGADLPDGRLAMPYCIR
jgi:hypothetical protein